MATEFEVGFTKGTSRSKGGQDDTTSGDKPASGAFQAEFNKAQKKKPSGPTSGAVPASGSKTTKKLGGVPGHPRRA